ncbi:hypothetical protein A9Q83_09605 [Alphaproteobacteria bacterium 46_93_T64]|mgnify:CR=1 FL=1|nr:hypothetical protein A9Q83_09605 [Alphaproteobacteria bacterium 46_93_T64]
MNFVRNLILSLVFGGVVSLAATTTQAADFNYQFTGTEGTVSGTITLREVRTGYYTAERFTIRRYENPNGTIRTFTIFIDIPDVDDQNFIYNTFRMEDGKISYYRLFSKFLHMLPFTVINWNSYSKVGNELSLFFPPPNNKISYRGNLTFSPL